MSSNTRRGRRRLPAVTRKQYRTRIRDLQDNLRQANHQLAGAGRLVSDQQSRIAELEAEVARLRAERVDASVLRQQLTTCEKAYTETNTELLATRAELQNATARNVPRMVRDTDPGEQPTEPIHVQTLRDDMAARDAVEVTPEVRSLAEALGGQR